jgi:dUTP pyrophosphatase
MHLKIPTIRAEGVSIPTRATGHAAGYDLCAALGASVTLAPGQRRLFPTGLRMAIPEGFVGLICPRSGLALRDGITVLNAPGVIDADYRGDIGVILVNLGDRDFVVNPGDRIAQILFQHVSRTIFIPSLGLAPTERGAGGFGSTGVAAAPEAQGV